MPCDDDFCCLNMYESLYYYVILRTCLSTSARSLSIWTTSTLSGLKITPPPKVTWSPNGCCIRMHHSDTLRIPHFFGLIFQPVEHSASPIWMQYCSHLMIPFSSSTTFCEQSPKPTPLNFVFRDVSFVILAEKL